MQSLKRETVTNVSFHFPDVPRSAIMDDDDDDVIVLPNEEPSVTEIVDDDDEDEYVPSNVTRAEMGNESQDKTESNSESKESKEKDTEQGEPSQQPHSESANESDVEIQEPNIPFTDLDTYVEKEMDEATKAALLNVKIKEEPKDEYEEDEDDGFEDVGTVVTLLPLPEDEISIHSSGKCLSTQRPSPVNDQVAQSFGDIITAETQTHTIGSSASPATIERPASVTSLSLPANEADLDMEPADTSAATETELNGEAQESTHNLSSAGPALPLASIVNKIKINITKNTSSNSHNSASTATSSSSTTTAATTDSQGSAISVIGGSGAGGATGAGDSAQQVNAIQTISTIPVLCGGNTIVPKIATSAPAMISSISVIGSSYGGSGSSSNNGSSSSRSNSSTATPAASAAPAEAAGQKSATPPPPAVVEPEPEPIVELKPALQNVTLKRTKKVQNGVETSGLCSIM